MKNTTSLLYLTPRFLGTFFILLVFAFLFELAIDEIDINALLIASIPCFIALLLLIVAWIKEGIGGWLFVILGIIGILYPFATSNDFHLGFLYEYVLFYN